MWIAPQRVVVVALLLCALVLPTPASPRSSTRTHVIKQGETLWSIAHAYGVKVDEIMRANGIEDPTTVPAGLKLTIPGALRVPAARVSRSSVRNPGWPLQGTITSRYGPRRGRMHTGLDIAAPRGTIVVAAGSGRVVRGGQRWGRYGIVVLLDHGNGTMTLYAHLSRAFVRPGQRVVRGQAIGAVGSTGNATGPHLHFEVWRGDRTVNPLLVLPK